MQITTLPNPIFVTMDQMNEYIDFCNKSGYVWKTEEFDWHTKRDFRFAYIFESKNYIKLCFFGRNPDKQERKKKPYKWILAVLPRDGVVSYPGYQDYARSVCASFRKLTNPLIPDLTNEPWYSNSINSASPLLWYNDEYNLKKVNIYEYDLNSAYGWALKVAPLPDTRKPLGVGILEKNQIGFTWNGYIGVEGEECPWRFPLLSREDRKIMDDYIDRWYAHKINAKDENERNRAKAYIVIPIGNFQRYNWFMRSAVVQFVNNYIMDLADEYDCIIKYNTDAIISLKKIKELDDRIGHDLGQWKLAKEGILKYSMHNEQWFDNQGNTIETKIRGVRKSAIGEDFDIELGNYQDSIIYYLDYDICHVRKVYDINEQLQKYLLQN